jgi:hypothetical protein
MKTTAPLSRIVPRGVRLLCVGLIGLWLAGCATPDARIRENQALFDSLPAEAQAQIREGRVALGFTPQMVGLAVGEPDRRAVRTDATGRTVVWTYTRYEAADGLPVYTGLYHRYDPGYRYYDRGFNTERTAAREYFRVEFVEGKVALVQQNVR